MRVFVRDNNVDKALKALRKKMQREGILREMRLREHFEKPSQKAKRKKAEGIRRTRKANYRKQAREAGVPISVYKQMLKKGLIL